MAPVIIALRLADFADVTVLSTGQHRHMTRQILSLFRIQIDFDLDIMVPSQSLASLSSRIPNSMRFWKQTHTT
jgi:UDP-N-acetylglucosamine 2-epimerase (non-hydrolysing)